MRVLLIANDSNPHLRRIEGVASLVNGCQRYYRLDFTSVPDFARSGGKASPEALAKALERRLPERHTVLMTEDCFDDNWFSHEYRTSAVVTVGDWEARFAPPSVRAYMMYQVAQALMHFSADMSEEIALNMVHEPAMGCIYDLSIHKPDIKLGMVAGNVCHRCVGQLRALGTPDDSIEAVRQIVSLVRAEALGMPIVFDPQEVFVVMRFSHNDENDNAWKYGIKVGVESSGLRASRGDDRIESTHILQKVDTAIRRRRLIIAKVDENNLKCLL